MWSRLVALPRTANFRQADYKSAPRQATLTHSIAPLYFARFSTACRLFSSFPPLAQTKPPGDSWRFAPLPRLQYDDFLC
jgi:hypothetical protein